MNRSIIFRRFACWTVAATTFCCAMMVATSGNGATPENAELLSFLWRLRPTTGDWKTSSDRAEFDALWPSGDGQIFYAPADDGGGYLALEQQYLSSVPDHMDSNSPTEGQVAGYVNLGRTSYLFPDGTRPGTEPVARAYHPATGDHAMLRPGESLPGYQLEPLGGYGYPRYGNQGTSLLSLSGGGVTIGSNLASGGALWEWTDGGKQYLNAWDAGRQIQTAVVHRKYVDDAGSFGSINPTEAGDRYTVWNQPAGRRHGSPLIEASNQGLTQSTRAVPLDFNIANVGGDANHPVAYPDMVVGKDITLDAQGLGSVARYETVVKPAVDSSITAVEIPTAYLRAEFDRYWTYDAVSQDLTEVFPVYWLSDDGGPIDYIPPSGYGGVIITDSTLNHAMGTYGVTTDEGGSVHYLQLWDIVGDNPNTTEFGFDTAKMAAAYGPGLTLEGWESTYTSWIMTGTLLEVMADMNALRSSGVKGSITMQSDGRELSEFSGAADDRWDQAGNWSTGHVPGSSDPTEDAFLTSAHDVRVSQTVSDVEHVFVGSGSSDGSLTIDAGGNLSAFRVHVGVNAHELPGFANSGSGPGGGDGRLEVTAGTLEARDLLVGLSLGTSGTYVQSGGIVTLEEEMIVGGDGKVSTATLSGGALSMKELVVAQDQEFRNGLSGGGSSMTQTGGTLTVEGGRMVVGWNDPATYTLSGSGIVSVPSGPVVLALASDGSDGSVMDQQGGTLSASSVTVGRLGQATYHLSSGSFNTTHLVMIAELDLDEGTGSGSALIQTGGTATIGTDLWVGIAGIGTCEISGTADLTTGNNLVIASGDGSAGSSVVQRGGAVTVGNILSVGLAAPGSYTMTSGTLAVHGNSNPNGFHFNVGGGGTGTFDHSGGTVTVPGNVSVGFTTPGTYQLSGSGALDAGLVIVAAAGDGAGGSQFNQTGGTLSSNGILVGRFAPGHYTISDGTVDLLGGVGRFDVANAGVAGSDGSTVVQTGGQITTIGKVQIGDELLDGETGSYTISGGSLRFGDQLRIRNGSIFRIVGSSAIIEDLTESGTGMSLFDGTLDLEFDAAGISTIDLGASLLVLRTDLPAGPRLEIDGTSYTGGAGTLSLIDHGGYGWANPGFNVVSITGFSFLSTELVLNAESVDLVLTPLLEADFNTDGMVNETDLQSWQSGFGQGTTHAEGDADADGDVDGDDLLIWQSQAGTSVSVPAGWAVPEPSARTIWVGGVLGGLLSSTRGGRVRCFVNRSRRSNVFLPRVGWPTAPRRIARARSW